MAALGTASYMSVGVFQVEGLGGSVTAVPTNQTTLRQLTAVPWPVPTFGNPQRARKAKGEKTSEFVETGETSKCTGYDDQEGDLVAVMAPADGTNPSTGQVITATGNSFNFRAPKNTDIKLSTTNGNALTLSVDDPLHPSQLIVTVPGDGVSHRISLLGHGTAVSPVQVLMSDANTGANLGSVFQGIVLPYRFWEVDTWQISDPSHSLLPANYPNPSGEFARAFMTQANIELHVQQRGLYDRFDYDTAPKDGKLHFVKLNGSSDDTELQPLLNDLLTWETGTLGSSPLRTLPYVMYLFYVKDIDNPLIGGWVPPGKTLRTFPAVVKTKFDNITTNLDQYVSNLSAHEMGHKLSLQDLYLPNQNDELMFHEHTGNSLFRSQTVPCRLSSKEWITANDPTK
jgi:hypothetical protein